MPTPIIMRQRLAQQRVSQLPLETPEQIVAWLGAVQSQDYPGAQWSLGMRMLNASEAAIEQAYNEGRILRTHILRPTWHFVTPADLRWMLDLTAPRIKLSQRYYDRQLELDATVLTASYAIFAKAVEGGQYRTRTELSAALNAAGIAAHGQRLNHIVMHAELDGLLCSGPRRGKQHTYALLDERAPQTKPVPRDAALAELARRYFTSHGLATPHDFAWWSGLTVADAKASVEMLGAELTSEEIDGQRYWRSAVQTRPAAPSSAAFLLPTFDELLVGYAGFDKNRRRGSQLIFESTIMHEGQIIGSWKRTLKKHAVQIEIAPFAPLTDAQHSAISAAAERYGAFLGLPVEHSG